MSDDIKKQLEEAARKLQEEVRRQEEQRRQQQERERLEEKSRSEELQKGRPTDFRPKKD